MRKNEIKVGGTYRMKVSGRLETVRVDSIRKVGFGRSREKTIYDCTNLRTGRRCKAESAAKFRGPTKVESIGVGNLRGVKIDEVNLEAEQGSDPIAAAETIGKEGEQCDPFAASGGTRSQNSTGNSNGFQEREQKGLTVQAGSTPPSSPGAVDAEPAKPEERQVTNHNDVTDVSLREIEIQYGLKGDQAPAFLLVTERILTRKRVTKLCGYAGTGKTYLIAQIAKWAQDQRLDVTIAAPTHKAAGVISEKIGDAAVEVRTIHSLLGMKLEADFTNDTGGRVLTDGGKSKLKAGLVICDEASMIGKDLKQQIDVVPHVQWLFVGDLAQLPPVGEDESELLTDPDATLATVLRQKDGSEILTIATAIRRGDESLSFEPGRDVIEVASAEALFDAALERFRSTEYTFDAAHARMLVFRNDRRKAINARMRELVVDSPHPYEAGEWLVMYAQFSPEKSKLSLLAEKAKNALPHSQKTAWKRFYDAKRAIGNGVTQLHVSEEVRVVDVGESVVTVGDQSFKVWRLKIDTKAGGQHELPVLFEDERERFDELLQGLIDRAQGARRTRDRHEVGSGPWCEAEDVRKRAWSTFFALEETFAQVDYAYAMTVHKSQGSTFDHAFVDVPDLKESGEMRQRILYTAVTRPAKSLTFYR